MTGLTMGFAYGWGERENLDHQLVTIYRIKGNVRSACPLPLLPFFLFRLSPSLRPKPAQWTSATANGYEFVLVQNELRKVKLAYVTAGFFAISCIFHLFAVIAGVFDLCWFIYWRYAL